MSGSNIRNYQVNYAINAEGNAAGFFIQMAENVNKMQEPLNALRAQIRGISRSLQLLGKNENLKNLFALQPTLNLTTLKANLAEAEKLVSQSAERMATQLNTALANAASLKQTKIQSAAKRSKAEIQALMKDLEQQFYRASGGKKIDNKKIKGKDDTTAEAWQLRKLYNGLKKDLNSMGKMPKAATTVLDSVKRAEDITKTAKAVNELNKNMSAFKHKKLSIKIDADIAPAVSKINTLLETVRGSMAAIPVTLGESGKGKAGKSISSKTGKSTKTGTANISVAKSSNVENLLKGKEKALTIQANFNGGDAALQMRQSITRLQELAKTKPVIIRGVFNGDDAGFQLNQAIANLQKLADGKPIVLRATSSSPTAAPSNGTNATAPQTATIKDGKGSTQTNASKWTGATQSQINAWERHRQSMSDLRTNRILANAQMQAKETAALRASQQDFYNNAWGQKPSRKMPYWGKGNYTGWNESVETQAPSPVRSYENSRSYSARFTRPKDDLYSRSRAFWYPFTGNTSFGARTPMAVDMANGMGTMFAIGGAMSAVGSSLSQAVEYQNIMKTTNAILKNGTDTYSNGAFKGMEQIVRQVGKDTKFTAPQVASAAKFLAMAGYDIPAINTAIKPVSNIALIGDTDLGATADKLTNVMTTFGIMPEKMNDIADIMTTTFTRSNTDMMMLAESAKYAGGIAHLYGGNFQNNFADVMAMFGVLGNAGIQASSAGTTLRMMYQNLMQPNKNQRATLKQYGIYTRDTSGNPLEIVDILKQIAAKVPESKLADAIGNMFRITAQPGAAALATHLNGPNGLISLMEANRSAAGSGISENIANEKKNTISGLWAQVQSTFTEGVLQAFEGKEGGWAGMLAQLRDDLAKPETVETLRSIIDLVENLAKIMGDFAKVYAKVYNMFPGIINSWIKFQLAATQFGYLVTPIIQLIGVLSMLKTAILGTTTAAATATIAENNVNRARGGGAVSSVISGFAPRYTRNESSAAQYAAYTAAMSNLNNKKVAFERKANILRNSVQTASGGRMAISPLWFAPMSTFGNNPAESNAFFKERGALAKYDMARQGRLMNQATASALSVQAQMDALKSQRFEALRAVRRPEQLANEALLMRYMAMDAYHSTKVPGQYTLYNTPTRQQVTGKLEQLKVQRFERINAAATARHAARGTIASDVVSRYARTASFGKGAGLAWKNSFSAGQAMGTLSLAGMAGSIKSVFASLIGGLAKAIGMLTSPVGLAIGAIAGLGYAAYKIYDNHKEHKEQLELANKNSQWVSESYKQIQSDNLNASIAAGGFKPVSIGYVKQLEEGQTAYSLEKNNVVSAILDGKTKNLTNRKIYNQYVHGYKYIPDYLVTQWKRDNDPLLAENAYINSRGGYTNNTAANIKLHQDYLNYRKNKTVLSSEELQKDTQKLAIISQWASMATRQSDVIQAKNDLQKAIYDKDFKRAQEIVNAYKPFSSVKMSNISDAKTISEISDPNKYYEWQYAQYKTLKDMWTDYVGPAQNYTKALDMLDELKGKKKSDIKDNDMTSLAQTIMTAIPLSFNGTTAQITLDKMGRVDWIALANSVNNGIPFTIGEQQDILRNTYDAIYNDPNIQNFASVIDLLQTYLPQIANARSPFDEYHWTGWEYDDSNNNTKNDNADKVQIPLMSKPQETGFKPFKWDSPIKVPQLVSDFDEAFKKTNGNYGKATTLYIQEHPNNFQQSVTKSRDLVTNKYTRNGTVGGTTGKDKNSQKEYRNTYDRSTARPTQVVINIDKLANFDRTAIAKNADDRAIIAMIENKIAEAVAMISSQALNSASSLISQGV